MVNQCESSQTLGPCTGGYRRFEAQSPVAEAHRVCGDLTWFKTEMVGTNGTNEYIHIHLCICMQCMYACMHGCMYLVSMYLCIYACMDAWMHGCMDAWMHVCRVFHLILARDYPTIFPCPMILRKSPMFCWLSIPEYHQHVGINHQVSLAKRGYPYYIPGFIFMISPYFILARSHS